ncbi:hypothetical protein JR338_05510 [Chloroflexota bacterium]|nr:hypothetical protein JR338_05510 [Chloroflexota bacterium]
MVRDYGAGLTIDELIGMKAGDIVSLALPNERVFARVNAAAMILVNHDYAGYHLMELWGSGETIWMGVDQYDVIQVLPSGQIMPQKG